MLLLAIISLLIGIFSFVSVYVQALLIPAIILSALILIFIVVVIKSSFDIDEGAIAFAFIGVALLPFAIGFLVGMLILGYSALQCVSLSCAILGVGGAIIGLIAHL